MVKRTQDGERKIVAKGMMSGRMARLGSASQPLGSALLGLGLGLGLGSALGGSGRLSSSSGGLGSAWLGSARSAQLGCA